MTACYTGNLLLLTKFLVLPFDEISVIREILKSSLIITYIQYIQWNNCQIRIHQLQFFANLSSLKAALYS